MIKGKRNYSSKMKKSIVFISMCSLLTMFACGSNLVGFPEDDSPTVGPPVATTPPGEWGEDAGAVPTNKQPPEPTGSGDPWNGSDGDAGSDPTDSCTCADAGSPEVPDEPPVATPPKECKSHTTCKTKATTYCKVKHEECENKCDKKDMCDKSKCKAYCMKKTVECTTKLHLKCKTKYSK